MPLVKAKCTECDAPLVVDPSQKAAKCEHCGTRYLIEEAINHYNIYISSLHSKDTTDGCELTLEMKMELDAAAADLRRHDYKRAQNRFETLCDRIPQEYRVWWGQILAITKEFTADIENKAEVLKLCGLYDTLMLFVPEQKRDEIVQQFMSYIQFQDRKLEQRIRDLRQREKDLRSENAESKAKLEELNAAKYQTSEQAVKILKYVLIAGLVLGILGKSAILLAAAVVGVLLYDAVLMPRLEDNKTRWENDRITNIQELSQRYKDNELELIRIAEVLSKLTQ